MDETVPPIPSGSIYLPLNAKGNDTKTIGHNETTPSDWNKANLKRFFNQGVYGKTIYSVRYDPAVGIRIAIVLSMMLLFVFLKSVCKKWWHRHRWTSGDKYYLQYCKAKHQVAVAQKALYHHRGGSIGQSSYRGSSLGKNSLSQHRGDSSLGQNTLSPYRGSSLGQNTPRDNRGDSLGQNTLSPYRGGSVGQNSLRDYRADSVSQRLSIVKPDPATMEATARWIQTQPLNGNNFCNCLSCIDCRRDSMCNFGQMQCSQTTSSFGIRTVDASANQQGLGERRKAIDVKTLYEGGEVRLDRSVKSATKWPTTETFQGKSFADVAPQDLLFNGYCLEVCSFIDKRPARKPVPKLVDEGVFTIDREAQTSSNRDNPVVCEVGDRNEDLSSVSTNSMWNRSSLQQSLYNQDGDLTDSLKIQIHKETISSTEQTNGFTSQKYMQSMPHLRPQDVNHPQRDSRKNRARGFVSGKYSSLSVSTGQISSNSPNESIFPFSQTIATNFPGKALKQNPTVHLF